MGITYKDGEEYLVMYPSFRRWINRCIACGAQGYKPEIPEDNEPGFNPAVKFALRAGTALKRSPLVSHWGT